MLFAAKLLPEWRLSERAPGLGGRRWRRMSLLVVREADKSLPFARNVRDVRFPERPLLSSTTGPGANGLPDRLKGVHVLAVDDEEDELGLLRVVLESAGAEVATGGSAHRALDLLRSATFDAVIADFGDADYGRLGPDPQRQADASSARQSGYQLRR